MIRLRDYEEVFDNFVNEKIMKAEDPRLKEELIRRKNHSLEVERISLKISEALDEQGRFVIALAALFHDIGKFVDEDEDNHSIRGLKIIRENNFFKSLDREDYYLFIKMIILHQDKDLPHFLSSKQILYTKVLMDADRIAHMSEIAALSKKSQAEKLEFFRNIEDETISPGHLKKFIYGKTVKKPKLRNKTEIQASSMVTVIKQLSYNQSLILVLEEQILERIYEDMVKNKTTEMIYLMCHRAIERRLKTVK